jgi:hypothetical protein
MAGLPVLFPLYPIIGPALDEEKDWAAKSGFRSGSLLPRATALSHRCRGLAERIEPLDKLVLQVRQHRRRFGPSRFSTLAVDLLSHGGMLDWHRQRSLAQPGRSTLWRVMCIPACDVLRSTICVGLREAEVIPITVSCLLSNRSTASRTAFRIAGLMRFASRGSVVRSPSAPVGHEWHGVRAHRADRKAPRRADRRWRSTRERCRRC